MKNKIYLASPWFNDSQSERETRIKSKLRELGFDVWSPRENNNLSPITDSTVREKIFEANIKHMQDCEIIFAITDEKDMGTIWESGFICGMNSTDVRSSKQKIVIYYCETLGPNGMFNLMLAQSGDIVLTNFEELKLLPDLIEKKVGYKYAGIVE